MSDWNKSCAAVLGTSQAHLGYSLTKDDQKALQEFYSAKRAIQIGEAKTSGRLALLQNNCLACHGREGVESLSASLPKKLADKLTALTERHPDLAASSVELPRQAGSETRLRDALAPLRDEASYVLLDCPPSLGPLTINALVAADRVIVPVQTEYFALEGLAGLLDTLALVQRELNPRLVVAGMLLTMHDGRTRLSREVEEEVRAHFPDLVFDTVIPRNVRVSEAPSFGRPVTHHDPHCAGADAYFELAKEVAARG